MILSLQKELYFLFGSPSAGYIAVLIEMLYGSMDPVKKTFTANLVKFSQMAVSGSKPAALWLRALHQRNQTSANHVLVQLLGFMESTRQRKLRLLGQSRAVQRYQPTGPAEVLFTSADIDHFLVEGEMSTQGHRLL